MQQATTISTPKQPPFVWQKFENSIPPKRESSKETSKFSKHLIDENERRKIKLYSNAFKHDIHLEISDFDNTRDRHYQQKSKLGSCRQRNLSFTSEPITPLTDVSKHKNKFLQPQQPSLQQNDLSVTGETTSKAPSSLKIKQNFWNRSKCSSEIVPGNSNSLKPNVEIGSGSHNSSGRMPCQIQQNNQIWDLTIEQLRIENKQLTLLNRQLVQELEAYKLKDTLKEADYIINHRYNEELLPFKEQYILRDKKQYLLAFQKSKVEEIQRVKSSMETRESKRMDELSLALAQNTEIKVLEGKFEQNEMKLQNYKQELKKVQENLSEFKAKLQESVNANFDLQEELTECKEEVANSQEKTHALIKEVQHYKDKISKIKKQRDQLMSYVKQYQMTYQDIDIDYLHEEISYLRSENQVLKNQLSNIEHSKLETFNSSLEKKGRISKAEEEKYVLKVARKKLKTQVRVLEKRLSFNKEDLKGMFENLDTGIRQDYEARLQKDNKIEKLSGF